MTTWKVHRPPRPHPFATSTWSEDWVLLSGIGGHASDGSIAEGNVELQTMATLQAIDELLERAGVTKSEIVWFKSIVAKRDYLEIVDPILAEYFGDVPPAAGAPAIHELVDPRMCVEFEVWAARGARRELE